MYKYDEEILRRLQNVETDMLRVFDNICQKYQIEYFLGFGTAIGAIRHKGFIPWDDDIDVCMMREDYERLKTVPKDEWGDLMLVDPTDSFPAHTLIYPQIYKKGTVFQTKYHEEYDEFPGETDNTKTPIWLDIFLFDRVRSIGDVQKKSRKAFFLQKLYYYSKSKIRVLSRDALRKRAMCFTKRAAYLFLSADRNAAGKIFERYLALAKGTGDYITSFDLAARHEMIDCFCRYDDAFPPVRVPFETITVSIQKNYDAALERLYGDYMSMPPAEKRYNHPPKILDFGDGKGNVINEIT